MKLETMEEVKAFFEKDRFAVENGARIVKLEEDSAICAIDLTERHMNAAGNVMGGVYFTLADFTFAVATNRTEALVVSLNASITYLEPIRGKTLFAIAKCIKKGRTTCFYEVHLQDEEENLAAVVSITGFRIQQKHEQK